jgi:DNA ligase 1
MKRFAELLDRLSYEHGRNNKLRLMTEYFRLTPDPERGYALAALTGSLSFRHAKPGMIRALISERADPVLFALSLDYVGDLSETVALMWPARQAGNTSPGNAGPPDLSDSRAAHFVIPPPRGRLIAGSEATGNRVGVPAGEVVALNFHPTAAEEISSVSLSQRTPCAPTLAAPTLTEVVTGLASLGKADLSAQLARWLDALDETGRWALLKLVTGELRIGVSARLARSAVAALGGKDAQEIELIWSTLAPPYVELFAWLEGRADKPAGSDPAPFRPPMLAHALEERDCARSIPPISWANGNGTASACRQPRAWTRAAT